MLASDIFCLILLGVAILLLLCFLGVWIEWVWKRKGYGLMMKIAGVVAFLVLLGIFVGAIISIVVIM